MAALGVVVGWAETEVELAETDAVVAETEVELADTDAVVTETRQAGFMKLPLSSICQ